MRRLIALYLVVLLIPSLGAADTLYKWVDDQGNVHYSNKPAPGATKIEIPRARTFTPPQVAVPAGVGSEGHKQAVATGPATISITSPQDQETLWNVTSVNVSVKLDPGLQPNDSVTITVDGVSKTVNTTSASFENLDRGSHTVTASLTTSRGVTSTATGVTFYIQKTTQKKPP